MDRRIFLKKMDAISGGDENFKEMLIMTLKDEIPKQFEAFMKAWNDKNAAEAKNTVHKLKGSLSAFLDPDDLVRYSKAEMDFYADQFLPETDKIISQVKGFINMINEIEL